MERALSSRVEITPLRPGEEEEWDRFVLSSPSGTLFHLSGWKTVVERVLGHRSYYLAARDENGIRGVFPIFWVRNRLFGDCLVSVPLASYGGICADEEDSYFGLLAAGNDLATRLAVNYLEMRNRTELFPTSLPGKDLYVTFLQDLTPGPDALFKRLAPPVRNKIRKSLKAGLEWVEDLSLDEFYEIYARNVHRLGTPVFPRELFVTLRKEMPNGWRLFGVRKGKQAIAGALCCYFQRRVMSYYAGSLDEFYRDAPNNFMYWNLIEQSCKEGMEYFDFGRSKRGTGSFLFKVGWSMQMIDLPYRYCLVRAKQVPQLSPVDSKFRLPVAAWKRLPYPVTKVLGPSLIKWLPSI